MWVKFTTVSSTTNRLLGTDDNWEVRVTTDWTTAASPRFSNELWSSSSFTPPTLSTTVPVAGTWYHVAFTVNSKTNPTVYVNGILEAQNGAIGDTATGTALWIGNRNGAAASQCTNGVMEDIRVYNRVLTANEIATIYNLNGADHIWYGLQNRWLLNEGSNGATVTGAGVVKDMVSNINGTASATAPTWTTSRLKWRGKLCHQ